MLIDLKKQFEKIIICVFQFQYLQIKNKKNIKLISLFTNKKIKKHKTKNINQYLLHTPTD